MSDRIIEITPELERRILQERRREPREKMADMERRLAEIARLTAPPYDVQISFRGFLEKLYKLASNAGV